jgi:hypothetical protein
MNTLADIMRAFEAFEVGTLESVPAQHIGHA